MKTKLELERNSEDSEGDKRREDGQSSRESGAPRGKKRKRDQRGDNMSSAASTCSEDSERSMDSGV